MDIVLLYHRNEIFKPTNSGRLIAEIFPNNVYAFEWSRLSPPEDLVNLLEDEARQCLLVFPSETRDTVCADEIVGSRKKTTLIFLDATWRQARKMSKSPWLEKLSCLDLTCPGEGLFTVRNASRNGLLSTAEAASGCLAMLKQQLPAKALKSIFNMFNKHCESTRACTIPRFDTCDHQYLMAVKKSINPS